MVNTPTVVHPNPFVNTRRELPWPPPSSENGKEHTREISFQVWVLDELQAIAQRQLNGEKAMVAVTTDCSIDMQAECMSFEELADLILMLEPDDYENSLWCMKSQKEGVAVRPELHWLPCDAYTLPIEQQRNDGTTYVKTYYLKMCKSPTGTILLMVSVHPSIYQ